MLGVRRGVELGEASLVALAELQRLVNDAGDYPARVESARSRWDSQRKGAPPFDEVRASLDRMCWGERRCHYCEDSVADEIEHFRPKDLYPGHVFDWENYLYACGQCNGPKGNRFAVFPAAGTEPLVVARARGAAVTEPAGGEDVLLNPRRDNPLLFFMLDIQDTFLFNPRPNLASRDRARATYTLEVLRLNKRPYLARARRTAYSNLVNALASAAENPTSRASTAQHRAHLPPLRVGGNEAPARPRCGADKTLHRDASGA
jgi:uncharacterized protein (TIGR02646 family)